MFCVRLDLISVRLSRPDELTKNAKCFTWNKLILEYLLYWVGNEQNPVLLFCICVEFARSTDYARPEKCYACIAMSWWVCSRKCIGNLQKMICLLRIQQNIVRNAGKAWIFVLKYTLFSLFPLYVCNFWVGSEPIVWIEVIWLPELLDIWSVYRTPR